MPEGGPRARRWVRRGHRRSPRPPRPRRRAILIGTPRWTYHVLLQRNTGHPLPVTLHIRSLHIHSLPTASERVGAARARRWHLSEGLMTTCGSVRDGPRFAGEDLLDHRTEELKRTVLELPIETVLVVLFAELHAVAEPLVAAILFTGVPHATHVRGVVVLLELGVDLDD